jgi:K+-sensing histidine kinase KdpD
METPTLTEAEQALARERQALAQRAAELDRREYLAFCEHDLRGKLTPAIATTETVVDLMECLNNTTVEFSEGEERPIDKFKALLKNLPTQVEFSEVAKGEIPDGEPEFKEPTKPAWQVARENAWKAAE